MSKLTIKIKSNNSNTWIDLQPLAVLILVQWSSVSALFTSRHSTKKHKPNLPSVLFQATLERTHQALEEEKRRTVDLLYSIFPGDVAQKLWQGQPVPARKFDDVTMLFSDIVGFTAVCAQCTPMQVISMLNELYTRFDYQCGVLDVYKVSRQKHTHLL